MAEIKYIPVVLGEIGLVSFASVAPPSMLNLCIRIDFLEPVREDLLLSAARATVERLPYCRHRFHDLPDGITAHYESPMEEQNCCEVYDFTSYPDKKVEKTLEKWAGEPFPNNIRDVQLYRFRLLRLADGKTGFFLCGHHMIMDIYALTFTGTYLLQVYQALLEGRELPPAGADPGAVLEKTLAFENSEKIEKRRAWVRESFSTEPQFTSINGLGGKEFVRGKRYGKDRSLLQMKSEEYVREIPAELANSIQKTALAKNLSPYLFYILALRSYLARVNQTEDVEFMSLTTNRATLAEKTSGLVRAEGVAFRSILGEDLTFDQSLLKLDVLHKNYLKHMGIDDVPRLVEGMYHVPQGMHYHSIMFSYAPFLDFSRLPVKIRAKKIDSGISYIPLYCLIIPADDTGKLYAYYTIAKGYVKPENVERYHAFLLKFLEAGLKQPEKTIKELVDNCI